MTSAPTPGEVERGTTAKEMVYGLCKALDLAAQWFAEYAEQHEAKQTDEGDRKAKTNAIRSAACVLAAQHARAIAAMSPPDRSPREPLAEVLEIESALQELKQAALIYEARQWEGDSLGAAVRLTDAAIAFTCASARSQ